MSRVARSIKLLATEHATPQHMRVAFLLLTLVTLVISAGAPGSGGGPHIGP